MKIVFMTAFDIQLEEFRDIIPAIEINDIIKKPFDIDDLATQIRHNLESQIKNYFMYYFTVANEALTNNAIITREKARLN